MKTELRLLLIVLAVVAMLAVGFAHLWEKKANYCDETCASFK